MDHKPKMAVFVRRNSDTAKIRAAFAEAKAAACAESKAAEASMAADAAWDAVNKVAETAYAASVEADREADIARAHARACYKKWLNAVVAAQPAE